MCGFSWKLKRRQSILCICTALYSSAFQTTSECSPPKEAGGQKGEVTWSVLHRELLAGLRNEFMAPPQASITPQKCALCCTPALWQQFRASSVWVLGSGCSSCPRGALCPSQQLPWAPAVPIPPPQGLIVSHARSCLPSAAFSPTNTTQVWHGPSSSWF